MIEEFFYKIFGTPSARRLKKLQPALEQINALEPDVQKLPPEAFPAKTEELRKKVQEAMAELPENLEKEERARRMIAQGKMTEAGRTALPEDF